jgi:hypothetical protein
MGWLSNFAERLRAMRSAFRARGNQLVERPDPRGAAISPERLREMLLETLDDPAFARAIANRLALPTFPIHGASCSGVTSPGGTQG